MEEENHIEDDYREENKTMDNQPEENHTGNNSNVDLNLSVDLDLLDTLLKAIQDETMHDIDAVELEAWLDQLAATEEVKNFNLNRIKLLNNLNW